MSRRVFSRAEENPLSPEARGECGRCGGIFNRKYLIPQSYIRFGGITDSFQLVCPRCFDLPNKAETALNLPKDPPNTRFASPDYFFIDEFNGYTITCTFSSTASVSIRLYLQANQTLALTATGSVAMAPHLQINDTLTLTAAGSVTLTPYLQIKQALALTAAGALTLAPFLQINQTLALTAAGSVTLAPFLQVNQTFAPAATAALTIAPIQENHFSNFGIFVIGGYHP